MGTDNDDRALTDDEIAQRMERGIRRLCATPPKPHGKSPTEPSPAKRKERPGSKGGVYKAEASS